MNSAAAIRVSSIEDLRRLAESLVGVGNAVEVDWSQSHESDPLGTDDDRLDSKESRRPLEPEPNTSDVELKRIEIFTPPRGTPDILYGHYHHPYEDARSFQDVYEFFANQCRWAEFVRPGSLAIDIGAHAGDTTLVLASLVGPTGKVVAFDPNPTVVPTLRANALLNHQYDIVIEQVAIAATSGTSTFADHNNLMCNGGLVDGLERLGGQLDDMIFALDPATITVPTINLVEYLAMHDLPESGTELSLIKIDCEGWDPLILESIGDLVRRLRPTVFVEWFDWFSEVETEYLFRVIHDLHYVPLVPATLEIASPKHKISDLLCVPRDTL